MKSLRQRPLLPSGKLIVAVLGVLVATGLGWLAGQGHGKWALAVAAAALSGVLLATAPQVLVFVGGIFLLIPSLMVMGIPANEVGIAISVTAALVMMGSRMTFPPLLLITGGLFLAWAVAEQFINPMGELGNRRLLHIALWVGLAVAASCPKFPKRPLLQGSLVGILLSIPYGLLFPSTYEGRFAGFTVDPNMYASTVAILTPLIVSVLPSRATRAAMWVLAAALVVAAQSRTGMVSVAVGAAVYYTLPYLRSLALAIPAVAGLVLWIAPSDLRTTGDFAAREGSDELRERIRAAAADMVRESPLNGHGLSTRVVNLARYGQGEPGEQFYFHNSYYALIAEVGLVGGALWLAIVVGALWASIRGTVARGAVAAVAAGLTMGTQLGEVLLDPPLALALGLAWATLVKMPTAVTPNTRNHADRQQSLRAHPDVAWRGWPSSAGTP